jgi:metallo-beta-lactamase class B
MKRLASCLIVAGCLWVCRPAVAQESLGSDLSVKAIAPQVFVVSHAYPWPANSVVALMEDGRVLMIDTPYTPEATEKVLAWIAKKAPSRRIVAINTHFHIDRLGGNAALVRHAIPIYGSDLTVKAIKQRGRSSIEGIIGWIKDESIRRTYRDFTYVAPDHVFAAQTGLDLHFGKEPVFLRFPGAGHSPDNLIVLLPKKGLIFGGCMILASDARKAGNVADGDVTAWLKAVRTLKTEGYSLVVPGHGEAGGISLVQHTVDVLGGRP